MRSVNEDRLQKTLKYILEYQKRESKTPTYREIQKECGYISLGTVAADVARLKQRHMIESSNESGWSSIKLPNRLSVNGKHNCYICGAVPCGQPSPAIEDIEATVALPDAIFGRADHVILHANGPSMIKRGIFDGDLLVVRKQPTAKLGDTVIAMLENGESTCKILAEKNGKYYLRAANDEVNEIGKRKYDVYPESDWSIFGVVDYVIHAPVCDEFE